MKNLLLLIIVFALTLPFVSCLGRNCGDIVPDKVAVSKDGRIKLGVKVGDSAIIFKLTNISPETLSVDTGDIEGGFCYDIGMYDHEGKRISRADFCVDKAFDAKKANFSKAFFELEPRKSVCKVYRENERVYGYQVVCSFEGRIDITRHTHRMPPIKDISRVRVVYDTNWILGYLAWKSDQKIPKNAFLGSESVEWNREPQEQESTKAFNPDPPAKAH